MVFRNLRLESKSQHASSYQFLCEAKASQVNTPFKTLRLVHWLRKPKHEGCASEVIIPSLVVFTQKLRCCEGTYSRPSWEHITQRAMNASSARRAQKRAHKPTRLYIWALKNNQSKTFHTCNKINKASWMKSLN